MLPSAERSRAQELNEGTLNLARKRTRVILSDIMLLFPAKIADAERIRQIQQKQ